jgi:hypothetical protein
VSERVPGSVRAVWPHVEWRQLQAMGVQHCFHYAYMAYAIRCFTLTCPTWTLN